MKILLNILGIILYFIIRYGNRTDKTQKFSGTFWLNDNWIETVCTLILNVIILILFAFGGVTIDYEKLVPWLPAGVAIAGDLASYVLIGLILSHGAYEGVAKFLKSKPEDPKE